MKVTERDIEAVWMCWMRVRGSLKWRQLFRKSEGLAGVFLRNVDEEFRQ